MNKATLLKKLIQSNQLEFIMEAHNGMSARIVEEVGFKAIWASGLTISASLGVRDNNEASWTQILEVLEFMSDATTIPILFDGDTGFGNFNNARRLVKKLEQRRIAGVCIEDKIFPKTNSFINSESQSLASIDEFCGKIKAMKDSQTDPDFIVVARTEAFIAGLGLKEALKRAEAYYKAGADAILVHSKITDLSQIESFMKEWGNKHPIIIVPTKYYSVPTEKIKTLGISSVIWANHNLRAAIDAMKKISTQIYKDQSLQRVENLVTPLSEVFRLQGAEELKNAEKKYLPTYGKKVSAIILSASQGDLNELTKDTPKTLIKVNGKTILNKQIEILNQMNITDITVVRGFKKHKISSPLFQTIDNDQFQNSTEFYSFFLAKDKMKGNTIISYGDIIYKDYILHDLLNDQHDITIVVDADVKDYSQTKDFVYAATPFSKNPFNDTSQLVAMSDQLPEDQIHGEFIGLWKVSEQGILLIEEAFKVLAKQANFKQLTMADLFNYLGPSITVKYIRGSWLDIDSILDLQKAGDILD